jgi:hypothetical protein
MKKMTLTETIDNFLKEKKQSIDCDIQFHQR